MANRRPKRRPIGYWADWDNVKREMNKAIDKNKGKFPTARRLIQMGRGDLLYAMRMHGGIPMVREKIGYNQRVRVQLARELEKIADSEQAARRREDDLRELSIRFALENRLMKKEPPSLLYEQLYSQ